jgi:hypothetical protein
MSRIGECSVPTRAAFGQGFALPCLMVGAPFGRYAPRPHAPDHGLRPWTPTRASPLDSEQGPLRSLRSLSPGPPTLLQRDMATHLARVHGGWAAPTARKATKPSPTVAMRRFAPVGQGLVACRVLRGCPPGFVGPPSPCPFPGPVGPGSPVPGPVGPGSPAPRGRGDAAAPARPIGVRDGASAAVQTAVPLGGPEAVHRRVSFRRCVRGFVGESPSRSSGVRGWSGGWGPPIVDAADAASTSAAPGGATAAERAAPYAGDRPPAAAAASRAKRRSPAGSPGDQCQAGRQRQRRTARLDRAAARRDRVRRAGDRRSGGRRSACGRPSGWRPRSVAPRGGPSRRRG